MRVLIVIYICFFVNFTYANDTCITDLGIKFAPKHQIIGCDTRPNMTSHFSRFNFARQAERFKLSGQTYRIQLKYKGDWLVKPNFYQLGQHYLAQIQSNLGKLLYEDKSNVTYQYFYKQNSYWLSLNHIGNDIHGLKIIRKKGIIKAADYHLDQLKSRMKRYGKAIFYNITANAKGQYPLNNSASLKILIEYLKLNNDSKFFIVVHLQHNHNFEIDYHRSTVLAKNLKQLLIDNGVLKQAIIVKGIGPLSPISHPIRPEATDKNSRIELIAR